MQYTRILLLFIQLILAGACSAAPDSILHRSFAEQAVFVNSFSPAESEELIPADSLEKLIKWAKKNDDAGLAYHLELSRMAIWRIKDATDIQSILELLKEAEEKGYIYEAAYGYANLGEYFWEHNQDVKALQYGLQGYELYKNAPLADFPDKTLYQLQLANKHFQFREYDKARDFILQLREVTDKPLIEVSPRLYNILALCYRELKMYDSAIYYFKQVYDYMLDKPKGVFVVAVGNLGSIYYKTGDYDNALKWLKEELSIWKDIMGNNNNISSMMTYIAIADIYQKQNKVKEATKYLDTATLLKPLNTGADYRHINTFKQYYVTAAHIYNMNGMYNRALLMMDSALWANDSAYVLMDHAKVIKAEKSIEEIKHNAEKRELQYARERSVLLRNFFIIMILFLSVVAILLINRNRSKHIQKELKLERDKNKAEAELATFTLRLHEKNRQLLQLQEEVNELTSEHDIQARQELIAQMQDSTILTDEEWDDFRRLFEQVHVGYIGRIKEHSHDITPAEMRYMVLIKLGMNNKEIAGMLGIGNSSVRNYKFRLRKKFGLTDSDDLEEMIKNI